MRYYNGHEPTPATTVTYLGQLELFEFVQPMTNTATFKRALRNSELNKLSDDDRSVHDWYRFVLSFPPHLVADYMQRFGLRSGLQVLDPFCGTGTTLVEAKKHEIASVGIEANAMAFFASRVKTDWSVGSEALRSTAELIAETANGHLAEQGMRDDLSILLDPPTYAPILRTLDMDACELLLSNSISPRPLHKCLLLRDLIDQCARPDIREHLRLVLAHTSVFCASNLQFGPEVGVGPAKSDAPVVGTWLDRVKMMARDIDAHISESQVHAIVHHADSRSQFAGIADCSVDAVFTSPPYPNEKDYTRTTRLESVLLGFVRNRSELQAMKRTLLRSNTRNVYKGDDDGDWVSHIPEIEDIAEEIERRRIEMGKTSGFERMYHRVAKLYFGGMARHFSEMRRVLKPGAMLGYVVGDQASYLRVMIRTGQLLAKIADTLGYEVVAIDLFRTRLATATREQLREEVVVLRWPGFSNG